MESAWCKRARFQCARCPRWVSCLWGSAPLPCPCRGCGQISCWPSASGWHTSASELLSPAGMVAKEQLVTTSANNPAFRNTVVQVGAGAGTHLSWIVPDICRSKLDIQFGRPLKVIVNTEGTGAPRNLAALNFNLRSAEIILSSPSWPTLRATYSEVGLPFVSTISIITPVPGCCNASMPGVRLQSAGLIPLPTG